MMIAMTSMELFLEFLQKKEDELDDDPTVISLLMRIADRLEIMSSAPQHYPS